METVIDSSTVLGLPIAQAVGAVAFVAGAAWWMKTTFYERNEAKELENRLSRQTKDLEERIENKIGGLSNEVKDIKKTINDMARDTSETRANTAYIRGRLEAKQEK